MSEFENVKSMTPFDNTQAERNTALTVMDEDERFIMDLTAERKTQFCSMVPKNEDEEDKIWYKGYTVFNFDQFEEMDEQTKIEKQKMLTDKKAKWENKKDYKKPAKKFDSKYAVVA